MLNDTSQREVLTIYSLFVPACPAAWRMAESSASVAPRFSTKATAPAACARPRVCASSWLLRITTARLRDHPAQGG